MAVRCQRKNLARLYCIQLTLRVHESLKKYLQQEIFPQLSPGLYYHGPHHTLDVYESALRICEYHKVNESLCDLIGAAALLHDVGYIRAYRQNEPIACEMALKILPACGYADTTCTEICEMIMATRVPQQPTSFGAQILCDADLDYLGRNDFEEGADNLFREFLEHGMVQSKTEWNEIQIKFLSAHHYFTEFSNLYREPEKQKHLLKLRSLTHNNGRQ